VSLTNVLYRKGPRVEPEEHPKAPRRMRKTSLIYKRKNSTLKGSDDGVLYLIKPRFWTLSIVSGYKNTKFGSWLCSRHQVKEGTRAEPAPETLYFYNLRRRTKSKNVVLSNGRMSGR
jgi:hypothetical protein